MAEVHIGLVPRSAPFGGYGRHAVLEADGVDFQLAEQCPRGVGKIDSVDAGQGIAVSVGEVRRRLAAVAPFVRDLMAAVEEVVVEVCDGLVGHDACCVVAEAARADSGGDALAGGIVVLCVAVGSDDDVGRRVKCHVVQGGVDMHPVCVVVELRRGARKLEGAVALVVVDIVAELGVVGHGVEVPRLVPEQHAASSVARGVVEEVHLGEVDCNGEVSLVRSIVNNMQ